jgi:isoleucyl-tRNA synthetase
MEQESFTSPTFGADDAKVAKEAVPEIPPMLVLDAYGTGSIS